MTRPFTIYHHCSRARKNNDRYRLTRRSIYQNDDVTRRTLDHYVTTVEALDYEDGMFTSSYHHHLLRCIRETVNHADRGGP